MKKTILITILAIFSLFNTAKAQTKLNFIGKTLDYQIDDTHLNLEILSESKAKWTYVSAPNNETGKTEIENCTIKMIAKGIYLIYWTEKDGSNVIDIFNLNNNSALINYTLPNSKLYNYSIKFKIKK
jgi:phenolic acid decarboxylase